MKYVKRGIGLVLKFFFQGLIFLVPLMLTAWVIVYFYELVQKYSFTNNPWMSIGILILGIIVVGWLTSSLIARPLVKVAESFLTRTPLVKFIYTSIKDLLEAFVGEKKRFTKPVLITLNSQDGLRRLGFITAEDLSDLGLMNTVAVYVPMSYSFSGNLFIVQRELVTPLVDVDSTEVMKFIIAGGVTDIKADDDDNPGEAVKKLLAPKKKKSEPDLGNG